MTQKLKNRIQKMTFQKQKVRRDKVDINDDVKVGLWDDITMYCVETPDLYN